MKISKYLEYDSETESKNELISQILDRIIVKNGDIMDDMSKNIDIY